MKRLASIAVAFVLCVGLASRAAYGIPTYLLLDAGGGVTVNVDDAGNIVTAGGATASFNGPTTPG